MAPRLGIGFDGGHGCRAGRGPAWPRAAGGPWPGRRRGSGSAAAMAREPGQVGLRVGAAGAARREPLGVAVVVEAVDDAVDPAEGQGLFDGVVVGDTGPAGVLLVENEPNLTSGPVIDVSARPAIRRGW
ncbi:MAG: hypothetical protein MZV64_29000 [Ignavibacteriales bacterium]|nr:hypothetical protein [Ignavibacteriales bacterium]